MSKIKVLIISAYNPYENIGGGLEEVIKNLTLNLKDRIDFDVLCMAQKDYTKVKNEGIRVIGLKVPCFSSKPGKAILFMKIFYNQKVKRFVKEHGKEYDVIHINGDVGGFRELSNFNTISTFHGYALNTTRNIFERFAIFLLSGRIERNNALHSKAITAVSRRVAEEISKIVNNSRPVYVIYNGIDTSKYRPVGISKRKAIRRSLGFEEGSIYALFVGKDARGKGLDIAIEAISRMQNLKLVVVGLKSYEENENVIYVGTITETTEKLMYYQASDFFLFPSRYDGFGIVAMEALSCGLPIIISKNTGVKEIIENWKNGIVINSDNPEEYAKAIKKIMDYITRKKISIEARKKALKFDWNKIAQKYYELYKTLIMYEHA